MGGNISWKELYKSDISILLFIASKSRLYKNTETTTSRIAQELNISQQSASRKLLNLEKKGFIKRKTTNKGTIINLTQEAISILKNISEQISGLFNSNLIFKGSVIKGLGEGKYYMKKQGYKDSFQKQINFIPWPGTLNLKLKSPISKQALDEINSIYIQGFKEKNRSFGNIKCYPCIILENKILDIFNKESLDNIEQFGFSVLNNIPEKMKKQIKCYLIRPERTSHKENILEIIAPINLRKKLNLKNNEEVIISIKT